MKTAIGLAIVAVHAAVFVALAAHSRGDELVIELAAPRSIDGRIPAGLADRVEVATTGGGLVHRTWSITYRGGFSRAVGASALAGPFQDPVAPPCGGRVVVGQKLLDQIARITGRMIDDELRGTHVVGAGDYQRVDDVRLRWAQPEAHLFDHSFIGDAPHGYIRATANVVFSRVRVPFVLAIVPERGGRFRIAAHAELELGNVVLQWLSDELGGDKLATRLARRHIDGAIATTLAPPPPLALGDGLELAFSYCNGDVEVAEGAYGALPFAVVIHGAADGVLPPHVPAGRAPLPGPDTALALDFDLDGLNAMLHELWRTGWLDRRLAEVGLDQRFAADPTVAEYLSIRISPPRLALPPVLSVGTAPDMLRLAADARIAIRDGAAVTTGRVWGALDFRIAAPARAVAVDLGSLELACERTATTLVPCYADLVAALRDRAPEFHAALTDAFARVLAGVFADRRLGTGELPAELAIRGAHPAISGDIVHLDLDATIVTN